MKKIIFFAFVVLIFTACNRMDVQNGLSEAVLTKDDENHLATTAQLIENQNNHAKILNVKTDLEVNSGWHLVPEGVKSMTITVEAENVETVLIWIAPTGTETWSERSLIGYDIDEKDGWSFTWDFGDRVFHDHITVQALGSDGVTQATETFNVHSIFEEDSTD